jgi:hypothetical protein
MALSRDEARGAPLPERQTGTRQAASVAATPVATATPADAGRTTSPVDSPSWDSATVRSNMAAAAQSTTSPEAALLRAVGASHGQVIVMLVAQAAAVGVLASIAARHRSAYATSPGSPPWAGAERP